MFRQIFLFICLFAFSYQSFGARKKLGEKAFRQFLKSSGNNPVAAEFTVDSRVRLKLGKLQGKQSAYADQIYFAEFKSAVEALYGHPFLYDLAIRPFDRSHPGLLLGAALRKKAWGKQRYFKKIFSCSEVIAVNPDFALINRKHHLSPWAEKEILQVMGEGTSAIEGDVTTARIEVKQLREDNPLPRIEELVEMMNLYEPGLIEFGTRQGAPSSCEVATYVSQQCSGEKIGGRLRQRGYHTVLPLSDVLDPFRNGAVVVHGEDWQTKGVTRRREAKFKLKETSTKHGADTWKPSILMRCDGRSNDHHFSEKIVPQLKGLDKDQKKEAQRNANKMNLITDILEQDGFPFGISHSIVAKRMARRMVIQDPLLAMLVYKQVLKDLKREEGTVLVNF